MEHDGAFKNYYKKGLYEQIIVDQGYTYWLEENRILRQPNDKIIPYVGIAIPDEIYEGDSREIIIK